MAVHEADNVITAPFGRNPYDRYFRLLPLGRARMEIRKDRSLAILGNTNGFMDGHWVHFHWMDGKCRHASVGKHSRNKEGKYPRYCSRE